MVPIPEEQDSTVVVVFKLIMTVLTLLIVGVTAIKQGIDILSFRFRKKPRMGFTKDIEHGN